MKRIKKVLLFCTGGGAYVGLELLYRGKSHSSMFAAGGLSFLLLGRIRELPLPWTARAAAGMGTITAVELATGLLVNRDHRVWDYRQMPYNFRGQICPYFTVLWLPLGAAAMVLYGLLDQAYDRLLIRSFPHGTFQNVRGRKRAAN